MKIFQFIVLVFCFSPFVVYSQHIAISIDANNFIYCGLETPITLAVENTSCDSIIVKTNNGTIYGQGCSYKYKAAFPGVAEIIIYKKSKKQLKEIGREGYRVKKIPDPIVKVGPASNGGEIQKGVLVYQVFIRAELQGFDYNVRFKVDSFTMRSAHYDSSAGTFIHSQIPNMGNRFNDTIVEAFLAAQQNDSIIFEKIYVSGPDKISRLLEPVGLKVIDNSNGDFHFTKRYFPNLSRFNGTVAFKPISQLIFEKYFSGFDTLKGNDAVCCSWGIYKKINSRYILHVLPQLPVDRIAEGYICTIDSQHADQTIELMVYDKENAAFDDICSDVGGLNGSCPSRYFKLQSGKFIIKYNEFVTILFKELVFIDPKSGEKIEFKDELVWKEVDQGLPG